MLLAWRNETQHHFYDPSIVPLPIPRPFMVALASSLAQQAALSYDDASAPDLPQKPGHLNPDQPRTFNHKLSDPSRAAVWFY